MKRKRIAIGIGILAFGVFAAAAPAQGIALTSGYPDKTVPRFAPDGRSVYCLEGPAPFGNMHVVALDLATGQRTQLTIAPARYSNPRVSRDGAKIAVELLLVGSEKRIFVLPTSFMSVPVRVSFSGVTDNGPEWSADSQRIFYQKLTSAGRYQVYSVPAAGGSETAVSSSTRDHFGAMPAANGGAAFFYAFSGTLAQIFRISPSGGVETSLTSGFLDSNPKPSPDCARVAFERKDGSNFEQVYAMPFAGGAPAALTSSSFNKERIEWSPDGGALVYQRYDTAGTSYRIFQVAASGGPETLVSGPDNFINLNPVFSPDGNFIAYQKQDASGFYQIYLAPSGRASLPAVVGTNRAGTTMQIAIDSPSNANASYLMAASFGNSPGIPFGSMTIPLNPDDLFVFSLSPNAVFQNFSGALDSLGRASAGIDLPSGPGLAGLKFYLAFVAGGPQPVSGAAPVFILP